MLLKTALPADPDKAYVLFGMTTTSGKPTIRKTMAGTYL
jgi:hypothetical protein